MQQIEDLALMKCVILANRSSSHFLSHAVRKGVRVHDSAGSSRPASCSDNRTIPCREDWGAEPCFVPQSEPQNGLPTYISIPLLTRTVGPQLSTLVSLSLVSQW